MVIGQHLDSFLPEQSDPASWRASIEGCHLYEEQKRPMAGLAMSGRVFDKAHLWRERRMLNELICFSNQFISEIDRFGLRMPKHYPLKEI